MTPRQALRKRNQEWSQALADGRVIRTTELPDHLESFSTIAERDAAIVELKDCGLHPEIVR